jgi:hypothetical protein
MVMQRLGLLQHDKGPFLSCSAWLIGSDAQNHVDLDTQECYLAFTKNGYSRILDKHEKLDEEL